MVILGIPVVNQHDLTKDCLHALMNSTKKFPQDVHVVLIDNGSQVPYKISEFPKFPFKFSIIKNKTNRGYYYPLLQLYEKFPEAEILGLMHNDVLLYQPEWEDRVLFEFNKDQKLGLVGFCGSYEVDSNGGRGGGTMCNFNGTRGQSQAAGLKISDLRPSIILDSLFMMFRRETIPLLQIDDDIVLCHFMDRIWPMRLIENGWRVGTLGLEIDHMGGMTALADSQYEKDAALWLKERKLNVDGESAGLTMYKIAEKRFLGEYRDNKKRIPCRIDPTWVVNYG